MIESAFADGNQVIGPEGGRSVDLGSFGVRFLLAAAETGGSFSLVEHPIPPRTLAAPLHRHSREDEYSYVLEGRLGIQLGDDVFEVGAGGLVHKPRGQWHTFWNAGESLCRILEIIAPGGFEAMFAEMAADPEAMAGDSSAALDARHGLDVDYASIERLCERFGLRFPG